MAIVCSDWPAAGAAAPVEAAGEVGVRRVTGVGGSGGVAVLSASDTVTPSGLYVPPLSGALFPEKSIALEAQKKANQ
jgi:hypothetical protein